MKPPPTPCRKVNLCNLFLARFSTESFQCLYFVVTVVKCNVTLVCHIENLRCMARNGTESLRKDNAKLGSFLKRSLPHNEYEHVRAHEACIVVSENENKSFKYVILTKERLYLTENPPKTVYEAAHLKDVVDAKLVSAILNNKLCVSYLFLVCCFVLLHCY